MPLPRTGVIRHPGNPIIRPEMLPGDDGANINGPSLIRVPDWVPTPLGRYYLYFAHHAGTYIRLAYADAVEGPWRVHAPGVLPIAQTPCTHHIASPDVHVDHGRRRIELFYHGSVHNDRGVFVGQHSFRAESADGLAFASAPRILANPYLRCFDWRGRRYAARMAGEILRAGTDAGGADFHTWRHLATDDPPGTRWRHTAVLVDGDRLRLVFTRIGDAPEHLLWTDVELADRPEDWRRGPVRPLLLPELDYEGADLPVVASAPGAVARTRALRDPCLFAEDGRLWLLYSVAGEQGIALAEWV